MLGLGVFLGIAKKAYTQFDSLFGALKARSTYYENDGKSRSEVSRISSAGILDNATILLTPTATSDARVHSVKTYTGDELVTNETSKSVNTGGVYTDILTDINATLGQKLQVTYTLTGIEGDIQIWSYTNYTKIYSPIHSTDGTYTATIDITGNNSSLDLRFYSPSGRTGTISNVSVIDVSSDFDFDRASSATRINSDGLVQDMQSITDPELVLNGDFPNGDNWNEGSSWTIADNKATATANGYLIQSNTFLALSGQTYSLTYTISNTNDASLQLAGGSNPFGATNLPRTNGTHTVYLTTINTTTNLQFYSNGFRGDLSNVSSKNITFSTDVDLARINYDSNGENGHILLEPTSTNFLPYSNDFSQSNWVKQTNITPTYNTTETLSPDGTYNATKLVGNGTDGIYDSSLSITGDVTRSVYLKSVSGTINVKLKDSNVDIGTETLTVTTEWQRFYLSGDNGTSSQGIWIDDIPLSGVYIFGAQVENLPYATSYIPTLTGSTVTREVEKLTGSGNAGLIESRQGSFYVDISALAASTGAQISISLSGGSSNDRVLIYSGSGGGEWLAQFRKDSSTYVSISKSATISNQAKIAVAWASGRYVMFVDGVKATTYSTGSETESTTFDGGDLTSIQFSPNNGAGGNLFYGKCKALAVFNEALSDTELRNLTS